MIQVATTIWGDPKCHLFYKEQKETDGASAQG